MLALTVAWTQGRDWQVTESRVALGLPQRRTTWEVTQMAGSSSSVGGPYPLALPWGTLFGNHPGCCKHLYLPPTASSQRFPAQGQEVQAGRASLPDGS